MRPQETLPSSEFIPVPAEFYPFGADAPFSHCTCCQAYLLLPDTPYVIEKAILQYPGTTVQDVAFEYAMCLSCLVNMRQQLSPVSLGRMEAFFQERVDFEARQAALAPAGPAEVADLLGKCLISGEKRADLSEYQLFAYCNGPYLNPVALPYMLAGSVMEEVAELLSPETKEVLDDFIDTYFGLPPELKKLVKEKSLLLI